MSALSAPPQDRIDLALELVRRELALAMQGNPVLNSPHEAYAVILEELDELWDEIKPNRGRSYRARDEAIQVAAMAVRYLIDISEVGR